MSVYRNVYTSFWNDARVDSMSAAEKGIFLYFLTSPLGNLCGCYEIGMHRVSHDTGYPIDTVSEAISNLEEKYGVIAYDKATFEVLVCNWSKYNWSKSPKIDKPIADEIKAVKSDVLREKLVEIYNNRRSIPYRYGIDTLSDTLSDTQGEEADTVSDTQGIPKAYSSVYCITDTVTNKGVGGMGEGDADGIPKQVIDYLNSKTGKRFKCGKTAKRHINARIAEGFGLDDFKAVVDDRCDRWLDDPKMSEYLRPETLFGPKFEGYLNSKPKSDGVSNGGWLPKAASW